VALKYARTHAPFTAASFAARYQMATSAAEAVLQRLTRERRLLEGEFRPGGRDREWTDANVLRLLRRRSLAKLRHEVEPVEPPALGRLATTWQGLVHRRHGADALLDVVEQLQGAPLPASLLESEILPARLDGYDPGDLDRVMAAGEVVWCGVEPLGDRDGRMALFLADHQVRLLPPQAADPKALAPRERAILDHLEQHGASFFAPLHEGAGGGYPGESVDALWTLVWQGFLTNDTMQALRAFTRARAVSRRRARTPETTTFRSRRLVPAAAEGRWSLVPRATRKREATAWATATTQQLLARHGVVTREAVASEIVPGGFGTLYPVLKGMEDTGRLRRGYFVAGLGATQFALPGALDLLRSLKDAPEAAEIVIMAATDPANPYGAALKWPAFAAAAASARQAREAAGAASARQAREAAGAVPDSEGRTGRGPTRSVGARVVLVDGALAGYLARGERVLLTWLPDAEPQRGRVARALAETLIARAREGESPRGMLLEEIDDMPATAHPIAPAFVTAGFTAGAMGLQATFRRA
jgi:ATP-dependent Lhr-like helicase